MTVSTKLRVAQVGLGVGKQHLAGYCAFPDLFEVRTICSLEEPANRAAASEFKVPHTTTSFDEVLNDPNIDVVDISTPPMLHKPQAIAALRAGKHVVCEKPLSGSLRDVDEMIAAERASGKRLMPIFQYRFGQGLQKLKMLQRKALTGKAHVATVEVHWRRRADYYAVPWRGKFATELGGVMTTHAIHAIDMLTYVLGSVKRVYARTHTRINPIEVEDGAAVVLELESGALATVSATLGSNVEVTRHRFVFDNLTAESNTRAYTNSGDPWTFAADTPARAPAIESALAEYEAAVSAQAPAASAGSNTLQGYTPPARYEAQIQLFHGAITRNEPFPVTLEDARRSIELLTAMYHSAETGQPVELPITPDHPKYGGWHN
jgi:predicted dehydrogenase